MASVEELIIKLTADNSDLKKKLGESEKSVGGLGKVVSSIGPMIAGAFAVGSVIAFATAAFKAAEQQMQVNKRLLFSLKGNTTAFKELADQAENLRAATGVDDAAIMQIQTLGGAAGYSTDKIKKITAASVELAAVTGQDLQAAYMQVNATFNGSAGRLTRLDAEFGTLSESQLRNGDAVDLLIKKYGGFAEKSATETAKLASNWDEFKESLGTALAGTVNPALKDMNAWLTEINNTSGGWGKLMAAINPLHYVIGKTNTQLKAEADYVKESKNQWKDYDLKQSQVGFLKTAEGIKLVAEKTAELRKGSKFLNAETEVSSGSFTKARTSLEKYIDTMEAAYKKAQELEAFNVPNQPMSAQVAQVFGTKEKVKLAPIAYKPTMGGIDKDAQLKHSDAVYTESLKGEFQKRREALEESLKAGLISKKQYDAEMRKVDSDQTAFAINNVSNMLGTAQSMFAENTLAYKGIAVAQAMMNTYLAATAAYAAGLETGGPAGLILGPVMAGVAVAAGLANVAKITGAFAMGGIVGGGSYSGDNLTARVNSGEMILNGNQQRELFAMANGMGARSQVEVVGYISGDVIRLANKRSTYVANRRG